MSEVIPDPNIESGQPPVIAQEVAQIPDGEGLETEPYRISFAEYKHKECEIDGLTKENSVCTLKAIRDVGVYFTDEANFTKNSPAYVQVKHVVRDNQYKVLYQGLEADQEVFEIKMVHARKAYDLRLFYFTIPSQRTFYILAARQSHYE